jgi:hypothetical protein
MKKLLGLLVIVYSMQLPAEQVQWQQPSFIYRAFIEVALRNEYSQRGNFVRKWEKPVNIWIDHQVGDKELHTDLIRMHTEHLSTITGHKLELVDHQSQANLKIILTRQSQWKEQVAREFGVEALPHTKSAVCMANFSTDGHYKIKKAVVIIPVDQARMHGKLVSCIVEEITQILGLPNDSEKAYPSIFNDRTPESLLSGLDFLLLKALYSDEVIAGMMADEVEPVIRKLLLNWQKDGTIQSAALTVKSGELYPLLGY